MAPLPGEFELIRRYFAPLAAQAPGALALQDDVCTIAPSPGHDLVLTVDALTAGIHFLRDDPPDLVARKMLRVNLSDLAAKGAKPVGFLLSLVIPKSIDDHWLKLFARGLGAALVYYCVHKFLSDHSGYHLHVFRVSYSVHLSFIKEQCPL